MSWTEEKVQKLKDLWSKGHTASQIAELLGDTTRNAVIGKAHRLDLEARAPSKNSSTSSSNNSNNKIVKRTAQPLSRKAKFQSILLDKTFESENPKSLEELSEKTCKWPIGHPNEESFYFCGRSPEGEFPYCKLHVLYAFQPKGQKEDLIDKEDEVPAFLEKKIKSAG
ncbi:GcrA family cell cycle regulator [Pelagibacteraceae bacterium]|jgi:GcrA cell cycle regulator|nr:GcrA family cell cycle regulator [Pelagibacteraceae bacterium]|tara:strand:- start:259 stop:762 length:504 start_codon:yes stop_codon:yes gene_type:complete